MVTGRLLLGLCERPGARMYGDVVNTASNLIVEQLKRLPFSSGVYLMKDAEGEILYVGKASSLRNRVRSYFAAGKSLPLKVQHLVARVHDFDFFVTSSVQEALVLELNLIKQYRPRYNVRLKDDKAFPYLKIDVDQDWPRVCITRRWEQDGARYFGPFASARSVRETMRLIKRIFPSRSCSRPITGKDRCPCLDYHIKNCLGPCIGAITREEYRAIINQIVLFLEGKLETIVEELKRRMKETSEAMEYEKAALFRDQVRAIESVVEGQRIAAKVKGEQDVIAFAGEKDVACVQVFFVRNDRLIGRETFTLQGVRSEEPVEIMTNFVKQFYASSPYVPPLILLQHRVQEKRVIESWLSQKHGSKVIVRVPVKGNKKHLVDIVERNARHGLELVRLRQLATARSMTSAALNDVAAALELAGPPARIEGYDISDIQGRFAVGSMVVFENGMPKSSQYRRFRIRTVDGADDFAMLREVLLRRFKRSGEAAASGWALPDLVLVDGGKGQLNSALGAVREAGAESVPVVALAKENEEVYVPAMSHPVVLPRTSAGLQLLERVRDEAHRFAIGYFHRVHRRASFASVLDSVPGIGPKRKRQLLQHFGSVRAIQEASVDELVAAGRISRDLAKKVKESALTA